MRTVFVCFILAAMFVPKSQAGDWPQILGSDRDGHANDEVVQAWKASPTVKWRVACGAGYAGVAVKGDKVLLWHRHDDKETLDCLSASDGKSFWRTDMPAVYRGGVDADRGPRSVPVIEDELVFVYGAAGDLHACSLADGAVRWTRELRSEYDAQDGYFGAGSTPIVVNDLLIVSVGGSNGAGLVAVDVRDGKTRWTAVDESAAYASPVLINLEDQIRVVAVMGLKTVVIEPATGKVVREFDFGRRGPTVNAATPLINGNQLFLTASYGIGCRMLDLSANPPKDLWASRDVISSQYATPVRIGDFLYAIDGREDMGDAALVCVRWADGKEMWRKPGFGTAHLIAVGDRVLAQTTDGRIELFVASPEAFRGLAVAELPEGSYRSLPALAGGLLFCRRTISATEGELLALPLSDD